MYEKTAIDDPLCPGNDGNWSISLSIISSQVLLQRE